MMTTIPQLRTGSCVKKLPHITKGTTYAFERMNNRARKPRIRKTLRTTNTSTYPRDYRTNRILRRDISRPTFVKNEHREDASVSQPIARRLEQQRPLQQRLRRGRTDAQETRETRDEAPRNPELPGAMEQKTPTRAQES